MSSPSTASATLEQLARDFSPRIEMPGASVVMLDVSGLERLLGPPQEIADALSAVLGKTSAGPSTIAIAASRIAAQLLAIASNGCLVVPPGEEAAALAPLPLDTLAHLGAPPDLLKIVERWGITTLGAFAALPPSQLSGRIGQHGLLWQHAARGESTRPLVPALPEDRFEAMLDLEWPVEGIEPLAFVLGRLLDPLCARLELRDRAAAVLEVRLRLAASREWRRRRLELPTPIREPRMLRTLICLDLEGHPEVLNDAAGAVHGIDRLGLFIEPTPGRIEQGSLLTRPTIAPDAAATLMARLRAFMGHDRCGVAQLIDTHRPDTFAMSEFVPPREGRTRDAGSTGRGSPRGSSVQAIRRLRQPIPARVTVDRGRPVRVITDRRGWSGGRVTWCAGPWRSSGDWWRPAERPPHERPYSRQEWDVALNDGARYRLHQDRQRDEWFIEAVLD
ncbi:MAG TPA: hypothetical protein VJP86_14950 [Vicinamibacterales bacterium]|nr:hypothetical protein [Vicinamibacterales bacterium]